jgi:hypothetical protein
MSIFRRVIAPANDASARQHWMYLPEDGDYLVEQVTIYFLGWKLYSFTDSSRRKPRPDHLHDRRRDAIGLIPSSGRIVRMYQGYVPSSSGSDANPPRGSGVARNKRGGEVTIIIAK